MWWKLSPKRVWLRRCKTELLVSPLPTLCPQLLAQVGGFALGGSDWLYPLQDCVWRCSLWQVWMSGLGSLSPPRSYSRGRGSVPGIKGWRHWGLNHPLPGLLVGWTFHVRWAKKRRPKIISSQAEQRFCSRRSESLSLPLTLVQGSIPKERQDVKMAFPPKRVVVTWNRAQRNSCWRSLPETMEVLVVSGYRDAGNSVILQQEAKHRLKRVSQLRLYWYNLTLLRLYQPKEFRGLCDSSVGKESTCT